MYSLAVLLTGNEDLREHAPNNIKVHWLAFIWTMHANQPNQSNLLLQLDMLRYMSDVKHFLLKIQIEHLLDIAFRHVSLEMYLVMLRMQLIVNTHVINETFCMTIELIMGEFVYVGMDVHTIYTEKILILNLLSSLCHSSWSVFLLHRSSSWWTYRRQICSKQTKCHTDHLCSINRCYCSCEAGHRESMYGRMPRCWS